MEKFVNTLWTRDNLEILHGLNSESVDLIYLDPPFNSKRLYSAPIGSKAAGAAFKDTWTWSDVDEAYLERLVTDYPSVVRLIETAQVIDKSMAAYLTYMAQRVIEMHRVLKPTGSIYLHCDPTASHYLKIMLDGIFKHDNFRNEIVWCYHSRPQPKKYFGKKHDIILFYSKSDKYIFNWKDVARPLSDVTIQKYRLIDDQGRRYRLQGRGIKGSPIQSAKDVDPEWEKTNPELVVRDYLDTKVGVAQEDWWEIDIINQSSNERTGYPTQKPLSLLYRIIKASSNIGDIVLDPFCGCATACVAAQQLQRRWIGIDIEEKAADILIERLTNDAGLFTDFVHRKDIPQRTDIQNEPISSSVKERLFVIQKGKCAGCGKEFDIFNLEVDHIVPRAKGGGDYFENYQLLCGACNRIKGARPMEYLRQKIRIREATMQHITFGE